MAKVLENIRMVDYDMIMTWLWYSALFHSIIFIITATVAAPGQAGSLKAFRQVPASKDRRRAIKLIFPPILEA